MSDCVASREMWNTVRDTLEKLMEFSSRYARKWAEEIDTLLADLYGWDPDEPVCYEEFWAKITTILWSLRKYPSEELLELLMKLKQNYAIPKEYREIIGKILKMQKRMRS